MKFPSLDGMKKLGEDLTSSAKTSKIFDKIKTSIDSLGTGDVTDKEMSEPTTPVEKCLALIQELQEVQRIQANLFNNLKNELAQLGKSEKE
jgi:hypothetical protein